MAGNKEDTYSDFGSARGSDDSDEDRGEEKEGEVDVEEEDDSNDFALDDYDTSVVELRMDPTKSIANARKQQLPGAVVSSQLKNQQQQQQQQQGRRMGATPSITSITTQLPHLPSADDILPAAIIVLLQANPPYVSNDIIC